MIKAKAIDHVSLWVRSLSEAKDYYERVFGFACTPREGDETTLVVESDTVHFFLIESKKDNAFLSKQHISFEVDSLTQVIENLDALEISEYDIGDVGFFAHRNYRWCEWRDPSGIRLECVEVVWIDNST